MLLLLVFHAYMKVIKLLALVSKCPHEPEMFFAEKDERN